MLQVSPVAEDLNFVNGREKEIETRERRDRVERAERAERTERKKKRERDPSTEKKKEREKREERVNEVKEGKRERSRKKKEKDTKQIETKTKARERRQIPRKVDEKDGLLSNLHFPFDEEGKESFDEDVSQVRTFQKTLISVLIREERVLQQRFERHEVLIEQNVKNKYVFYLLSGFFFVYSREMTREIEERGAGRKDKI